MQHYYFDREVETPLGILFSITLKPFHRVTLTTELPEWVVAENAVY
ncbi:Uncharacterised protein [Yersinia bercovieri]|nr:Uncharacterised protein [Yersinia bercovieri]CNF80433.1 Uncharacterised protein [Yersinia bercovieri]CNJ05286.1 Uncharacterised protein [Yersinia bercovieri]